MKIALMSETYFPHINGVTTHVKTLKDGLTALGHEVLVVTSSPETKKHYIKDSVLYCPAIKLKNIYGFGVSNPYSNTRLKMLKDFNPDIIHVHTEFSMGLFGIYAAKKLNKTLVYTLHTSYDDYIYYVMPKVLTRIGNKILDKYLGIYAKKSKAIVGPSEKCFGYIKKASHKKKVRILPNSVEMSLFNPSKVDMNEVEKIRESLNIPKDAFIACFVGRVAKEKGIDVTLEYLAKTLQKEDNIYFVVIGDGPGLDEFKDIATNLNINDKVRFTGRVEHEDLPLYYMMSKLYLTSSLSEMNSISMLEAMAMGLPVLQRVDEINKDQIEVGKNGYLFYNEKEMYKYLKYLSSLDEESYKKIKFEVGETVSQKDELEIARKELKVYEKAIERGKLQEMMKRKNKEEGIIKKIKRQGKNIKKKSVDIIKKI